MIQMVQSFNGSKRSNRLIQGDAMVRFKSAFTIALVISLFAAAGASAQNKPLKKIRVGVPSVGMGNIIIFVTKEG